MDRIYGMKEIVVEIMPEQGYYNVSNVKRKIFAEKSTHTQGYHPQKKAHERKMNNTGNDLIYGVRISCTHTPLS